MSRLTTLITTFNTPPHFGCTTSLFNEPEPDVYALLRTFLTSLPDPIVSPEGISQALVPFSLELPDIKVVQTILRLLPSANLSLFVYVLAFLSQVTHTRPGIVYDLGQEFGACVFGPPNGPSMLVWFINNWANVVRQLFEMDCDLETRHAPMIAPVPIRTGSLIPPLPSPYDRLGKLVWSNLLSD